MKIERFDLGRRAIAQCLMQPLPVVEDLDEVEDRGPRLLVSGEGAMVREVILERGEEALCHGVVETVAFSTHAGHDAVLQQQCPVFARGIDPALVGVMNQARRGRRCQSALLALLITILGLFGWWRLRINEGQALFNPHAKSGSVAEFASPKRKSK